MSRVTGANVKEIINTSLSASEVAPFVTSANLIVTERLGGQGVSAAILKEIERWLAAHLVAIRSQDSVSKAEKTGDASITRHGETKMGLDFTPYGQQAKLLDPTGRLESAGKGVAKVETIKIV